MDGSVPALSGAVDSARILVVEDEADAARELVGQLDALGYTSVVAAGEGEARERLRLIIVSAIAAS